jgi:hypothetical protein
MDQNQNQQNNQQAQPPQFKCSKDCRQCPQHQRVYCASQHALSNMYVLDKVMDTLIKMQEQIGNMQGTIQEMTAKIEAIQNSEAAVFDPNGESVEPEPFPKEFAVEQPEE